LDTRVHKKYGSGLDTTNNHWREISMLKTVKEIINKRAKLYKEDDYGI